MEWQLIVAPGLAVPIVLFPVAFVFYLNTGKVLSLVASFRERLRARTEQLWLKRHLRQVPL